MRLILQSYVMCEQTKDLKPFSRRFIVNLASLYVGWGLANS